MSVGFVDVFRAAWQFIGDVIVSTDPPTLEETVKAIQDLKNNKAPGLDCAITAEALQGEQWITNVIIPLPKKGDLTLMTNYRGISLMSVAAKVYNKILLMRIKEHVDPILRKNQAGFRPSRSCAQQIHILCRIMEGFLSYQLPLTVTFIDFKKAFDCINRRVMFSVLRHYGIPEVIVNAIQVLYYNSKSAVFVDGNISDPFQVTTGVLQGDVLAPFLFIVLIDYLMSESTKGTDSGVVTHPRQSRRHPAQTLNDLDFADDIALLESTIPRAQEQLTKTAVAGKQLGLIISVPKTEYMAYNCNPQLPLELEKIWRSPSISTSSKLKLFNTTCVTILLYGCESWVITGDMENKLNAFATSCYRVMLNIKRLDHVSNAWIYKLTNTRPLITMVRQRQLRFLGHALRMPVGEPCRTYALYVPTHGKRRPGRQRLDYLGYVRNLLGDTEGDLRPEDIAKLAADRQSEYRKRRPMTQMQPTAPFYLGINQARKCDAEVWFINSPMGKNEIGNIMSTMAEKGGFPPADRISLRPSGDPTRGRAASKHVRRYLRRNKEPLYVCPTCGTQIFTEIGNVRFARSLVKMIGGLSSVVFAAMSDAAVSSLPVVSESSESGRYDWKEEDSLVFYIKYRAERGFPINKLAKKTILKFALAIHLRYCEKNGMAPKVKKDTGFSQTWWRSFSNSFLKAH
ncbi:hypothetical protein Bbelb_133310 [Branchiostoma belcheri]|nr:hypothetical protein Bbelb_133310 [Branchiostoma belcheri]